MILYVFVVEEEAVSVGATPSKPAVILEDRHGKLQFPVYVGICYTKSTISFRVCHLPLFAGGGGFIQGQGTSNRGRGKPNRRGGQLSRGGSRGSSSGSSRGGSRVGGSKLASLIINAKVIFALYFRVHICHADSL